MSITAEIGARVAEGRLVQIHPAMPIAGPSRVVYAAPELQGMLAGPWPSKEWEERCGELQAYFDRFLDGSMNVPVAKNPMKGKTSLFKRLLPNRDEVWEMRVRDPKPGIRVFGRFAAQDTFIALDWWKREDLAGPQSKTWRDAIVGCKTQWANLFPAYNAFKADPIDDYAQYISNIFLV